MHRLFSSAWPTAISTRIGVVLLGLWLVIAPQWHLCSDSGLSGGSPVHSCCERPPAEASASEASASEGSTSAAGESCVGEFQVGADQRFDTFCLARYLEFFSLSLVAAFSFVALIRLVTLLFRAPLFLSLPSMWICHASRGPPCSC